MKALWSNFIIGAFLAILVAIAFNAVPENVNASEVEKVDNSEEEFLDTTKIEEVAKALQEKEKKLNATELRLKEWEDRLLLQEESVKQRVSEFKALTKENKVFQEKQAKRRKIVEERLKKTFESMKPKKVAEVLTVMEEDLAVELLMVLKEKKLAAIFDKMDSNKAMILSSRLAQERKPASEREK